MDVLAAQLSVERSYSQLIEPPITHNFPFTTTASTAPSSSGRGVFLAQPFSLIASEDKKQVQQ